MCTDNVQVDNGQRLGCQRIDVARGNRTHMKQENAGSKRAHWKQLESTLNMPLYRLVKVQRRTYSPIVRPGSVSCRVLYFPDWSECGTSVGYYMHNGEPCDPCGVND